MATAASTGKVEAIRYARERQVPFFGICLGLQCAVIEFARNVVGLDDANSTEIESNCRYPVICLLDEQYDITNLGGTMRLGASDCLLQEGSRIRQAYGSPLVSERHRHRYEFNNQYRQQFSANGMVFTGTNPDGKLVEAIELANHPWFVAVQFHPEFKSKPTKAQPLFRGLVQASLARREQKKSEPGRMRSNGSSVVSRCTPPPVSSAGLPTLPLSVRRGSPDPAARATAGLPLHKATRRPAFVRVRSRARAQRTGGVATFESLFSALPPGPR